LPSDHLKNDLTFDVKEYQKLHMGIHKLIVAETSIVPSNPIIVPSSSSTSIVVSSPSFNPLSRPSSFSPVPSFSSSSKSTSSSNFNSSGSSYTGGSLEDEFLQLKQ
jgi:hypothetical protein